MDSAQLVVLMLVAPFLTMLFVAWGVRGPSLYVLLLWRLQAEVDRVLRIMGEKLMPSIEYAAKSFRALHDAAIADGGEKTP